MPKTLLIEPLCAAFQKFSGIKKVWIRKRGERIKVFCGKKFVSRGRKFSYVKPSVLCCKRFPVAKSLNIREGDYQRFPSKIFCLTVRKSSFRRGFHKCFISFGYRESLWIREVDINFFNRIFFVSQCQKKS